MTPGITSDSIGLALDRLEKVRQLGEKLIAACPACRADGGDRAGNHLVIFEGGKFGCIAHRDDPEHRRRIFALAGRKSERTARPLARRVQPSDTPAQPATPPAVPVAMSGDVLATWNEGVEHLRKNPSLAAVIDQWRGWPAGTVSTLAEDGLLGCPVGPDGRRGIGFPVQVPGMDDLDLISTWDTGYHVRIKPATPQERARWSYHPTGCGALPFVIGGGFLRWANTIVVCEGQWDAITLAAAGGWLANDASWPERITLFATRGAGAWRPLIDHWHRFARKDAKFILFPDADKAGDAWKAPSGFVETLRRLGHPVRVARSRDPERKDLNALHKSTPLTRADIEALVS